MDTEGVLLT